MSRQRKVRELNDEEVRAVAREVKNRLAREFSPAKVAGFANLFPQVSHRFIHHTWVVIREKIEAEDET